MIEFFALLVGAAAAKLVTSVALPAKLSRGSARSARQGGHHAVDAHRRPPAFLQPLRMLAAREVGLVGDVGAAGHEERREAASAPAPRRNGAGLQLGDGCAARRLAQSRVPPEVTGRADELVGDSPRTPAGRQSRAGCSAARRRSGVRRRRGRGGRTTRACRYGDEHGTSQHSDSSSRHDAPGHDASGHEIVCSFDSTAAPEARATQRQQAVAGP